MTSMMVGGVAGLLLQMLHPAVLAGVWDHSNFRNDMHGRLRRTARFIALTTYGGRRKPRRRSPAFVASTNECAERCRTDAPIRQATRHCSPGCT